jgi:hypothetical protein
MALVSRHRRRLVLFCIVLLTAASADRPSGQQPALEYRWVGSIDWVARYTNPHGEVRHAYTIGVTWKERRLDVVDNGRTVGQVSILEDDGSRWSGTLEGLLVNKDIRSTVGGAGSGVGQPVQAWVYHSGASDDPLKEFDGAYGFASAPGASFTGSVTLADSTKTIYTSPYPSAVQFHAGGSVLYPRGTVALNATTLAAQIRQGRELAQKVAAVDRTPRALIDGSMTGGYTYTHPPGGLIVTMNWNVRRRLNIHGTLTEAPTDWRPIAIGGDPATLSAALDPSLGLKGRFRFTLFGVSREPGYAMNKGEGTGLDLRFSDDQPVAMNKPIETADGWQIETTEIAASAKVNVTARDYGAWGRLKAEVQVDGEWYDCTPSTGTSVSIPVDRNDNHIADVWEREVGISRIAAAEDIDSGVSAARGDGFSNYEEYRGFYIRGTWTATDPTWKELFIVDGAGVGIGDFASSQVVPLIIRTDEWDNRTRVVNFNRHNASAGAQKGLRLKNVRLSPGTLGEVTPRVGTPNDVEEVRLDLVQIATHPGALGSTIAHEIGHAVGIEHHGEYEIGTCGTRRDKKLIALWQGAHAGDRACVMTYSGADYYKRSDRVCREYVWTESFGHTFCRSSAGTDINAGAERTDEAGHPLPVSGDARRGNCQSQVRLK